jgi:uncharacterized protein (UPF0371 family)
MGLSTAARKLDLGVTKIAATNVQENAVSQAISQEAIARSRYGYTEAANTDSQGACNKQTGLAYNALSVAAPKVKVATIDVSKLDAISQQTNVANQANLQKATSITTGFCPDPASNTGWQAAGNVQIASAYNGVNLSI